MVVRGLVLAAAMAWCGGAGAVQGQGPRWDGGVEQVRMACEGFGCAPRPLWRYGSGRGFFPMRRFGPPPVRRFGFRPLGFRPIGFRPLGFRRFGPPRRW